MICPALPEGREMAQKMVREERLELSRIAPLDPKSSAYASFATLAEKLHILQGDEFNTASRRKQEERRLPGGLRHRVSVLEQREISLHQLRPVVPFAGRKKSSGRRERQAEIFSAGKTCGRRSKKARRRMFRRALVEGCV